MKLQHILGLFLVTLLCVAHVTGENDPTDDEEAIVEESQTEETAAEQKKKPVYVTPKVKGNAYLAEPFDSVQSFESKWVLSEATKDDTDEAISKYDGKWSVEEAEDSALEGDLGLVLKSNAKHHAVSSKLSQPYVFKGKPFIVQYEVRFQNGQECGGAYIKLLSQENTLTLDKFQDKTPYTIMFGPDKCGNDHKLHFIFRHKNPKTGKFEEKHAKKPEKPLDVIFSDKRTHLFTLVVNPDNTFEVFVDQELVNSGSLLEHVEPPVNPPAEIVDPNDKKPEDWDEREKIPDPEASKPDDWNEDAPEMIADPDAVKPDDWLDDEAKLVADPNAEKPSDWDDDMDGEWEPAQIDNPKCESVSGCGEWKAPQIKNPEFKGKWRAPMISNPAYKGKWKPKKIANPDYFEDKEPYKMTSIAAVGLELWSMSDNIIFDNFIVTDEKNAADEWAKDTWEVKHKEELSGGASSKSVVQAVTDLTNERPWLWAVFVLVVVLPIVLVIGYCCMGSSKQDDIAKHKKTDEPTPDDEPTAESDEAAAAESKEENSEATNASGDAKQRKKTSKGALEAEEENEADAEEDDEKEEATEQRRSPRKRKTRKD